MHKHVETFVGLEEVGIAIPRYRPTFDFPTDFINASHKFFSTCPLKGGFLIRIENGQRNWLGKPKYIDGWLRREDALKLYEMAYFASGDILELGSYHGLSTSILSQANQESPRWKNIYSVDLNRSYVDMTNRNLHRKGLMQNVHTICHDAIVIVRRMAAEGKRFSFVFIDHSHAYEPVYQVCRELGKIVFPGGFCLFHDFNDSRNRNSGNKDHGVYQAVMDGLSPDEFEFCGIYGCTGLYRARGGDQ